MRLLHVHILTRTSSGIRQRRGESSFATMEISALAFHHAGRPHAFNAQGIPGGHCNPPESDPTE